MNNSHAINLQQSSVLTSFTNPQIFAMFFKMHLIMHHFTSKWSIVADDEVIFSLYMIYLIDIHFRSEIVAILFPNHDVIGHF